MEILMVTNSKIFATSLLLTACSFGFSESGPSPQDGPSTLEIQSPTPGMQIEKSSLIAQITHSNLQSLHVNGGAVSLNASVLQLPLSLKRGINTLAFRGAGFDDALHTDTRSILSGQFGNPDQTLKETTGLFLGPAGLKDLGKEAMDSLSPEWATEAIQAQNPVYTDTAKWNGWEVDLALVVDRIQFSDKDITIQPSKDQLSLEINIQQLQADVRMEWDAYGWFDDDIEGEIWAESIRFNLELSPTLNHQKLQIETLGGDLSLLGMGFDFENAPDFIENLVAEDKGLIESVEDLLFEEIQNVIAPAIEDALAELSTSQSVDALGTTLEMEMELSALTVSKDGVLFSADVYLDVENQKPTDKGFLSTPSEPLQSSHPEHMEAILSDNLVNLTLYRLWQGGAFDGRYSTEDGTLSPLFGMYFESDTTTVQIRADMPPVVVHQNGELRLQLGEMVLELSTPGGLLGDHATIVLSGSGRAALGLGDSSLSLRADEPDLEVFVRENDWKMSAAEASEKLVEMLPMDLIVDHFRKVEIPFFSLPGMEGSDLQLTRTAQGTQTSIGL